MMNNFKTAIDGTGTTTATIRINYIRTLIHGESPIEFDELASQFTGTTNAHLNLIKEVLLGCFPSINALSNQKRAMLHIMRKPRDQPFNIFASQLT